MHQEAVLAHARPLPSEERVGAQARVGLGGGGQRRMQPPEEGRGGPVGGRVLGDAGVRDGVEAVGGDVGAAAGAADEGRGVRLRDAVAGRVGEPGCVVGYA